MKYGRGSVTLTDMNDSEEMYYEQEEAPINAKAGSTWYNPVDGITKILKVAGEWNALIGQDLATGEIKVELRTAVYENEVVKGIILEFNADYTYSIVSNKGTISNINNDEFFYSSPDIENSNLNTTDTISIFAFDVDGVKVAERTVTLMIVFIASVGEYDDVLSNIDFPTFEDENIGFDSISSNVIKSSNCNSLNRYQEKMVEQDVDDTDWIGFKGTFMDVKPVDYILTSFNSSTVYIDKKVENKNISLILDDGGIVDYSEMVSEKINNINEIKEFSKLQPTQVYENQYFGRACALSSDGLVLTVGSAREDTTDDLAGSLHTYKRNSITDSWYTISRLTGTDHFGRSCALSDDGLVLTVGAVNDSTTESGAGIIVTYKRSTIDDSWTEINKLQASDAEEYDQFGNSCALSADGLVLTVGAYLEDTTADKAGKLYTYKRDSIDDSWVEVNKFQSSDVEEKDYFGKSCALSADGLVLTVGADGEDTTESGAGKLYTYKRSSITSSWSEVSKLQANDVQEGDRFGRSCALSADGLILIVGASGEDTTASNAGKLYTYKRDSIDSSWTELNMLQSSDAEANDFFGASCALSADGLVLTVGADSEDTTKSNAGKLYTYNILYDQKIQLVDLKDTITEQSQLQSSDAEANDYFGASCALSADGLVLTVCASGEDTTAEYAGKLYTYKRDSINNSWVEVNKFQASDAEENDRFGASCALSADGLVLTVGAKGEDTTADNAGKLYTYKRDSIDDSWTELNMLQSSDIEASDYFGKSCALSADGLVLTVGAQTEDTTADNAGKLYTYKRDSIDDSWVEVNKFQSSDAELSDYFGNSCALSADGLVLTVGAPNEDTTAENAGKLYTYKRDSIDDSWTELNMLQSSDIDQSDRFGNSCALSADGLVLTVGAYVEDTQYINAGKLYTYKRSTIDSSWTELNMLQSSDIDQSDYFGTSCALSADGLVLTVGSQYEDTTASDAGKLYTYNIVLNTNDPIADNIIAVLDTVQDSDIKVKLGIDYDANRILNYDLNLEKISSNHENYKGILTKPGMIKDGDIVKLDTGFVSINNLSLEDILNVFSYQNGFSSSDIEAGDYFGWSCSLSADGLVMVVGAPDEDTTANNAGKLYTYKRSTIDDSWSEVSKLQASDAEEYDQFGWSCALSADGLVLTVGANEEDTTANNAGKLYTYKRTTIDDSWIEVNKLQSSDVQEGDKFGQSCALSADGLVLTVGANEEDTTATDAGKLYTYKRDSIDSSWSEVSKLQSSDIEQSDQFGYSCALSADGLVLTVGAFNEDTTASDAGKLYTYKRDSITISWTEVNMLQASDIQEDDHYACSCALSADGLILAVGSFNTESIYIYKRITVNSEWVDVEKIVNTSGYYFGASCALSADGLVLASGDFNYVVDDSSSGKIFTYKRSKIRTEVEFAFSEQSEISETAIIQDRSKTLEYKNRSFDSETNTFTFSYDNYFKNGRFVQRSIETNNCNIEIKGPFQTTLRKEEEEE